MDEMPKDNRPFIVRFWAAYRSYRRDSHLPILQAVRGALLWSL